MKISERSIGFALTGDDKRVDDGQSLAGHGVHVFGWRHLKVIGNSVA
jgi:hypothetical protein